MIYKTHLAVFLFYGKENIKQHSVSTRILNAYFYDALSRCNGNPVNSVIRSVGIMRP